MKRNACIFTMLMVLCLVACGGNDENTDVVETTQQEALVEEQSSEIEVLSEEAEVSKEIADINIDEIVKTAVSYEYSSEGAAITGIFSANNELQGLNVEVMGDLGKETHEYSFFEEYVLYTFQEMQYEEPFYMSEKISISEVISKKYVILDECIYDITNGEEIYQVSEEIEVKLLERMNRFIGEISENNEDNNFSVESARIQSFLNGKEKAVLSERYVAICSEAELAYSYDGTIDEIVDGYYENSAQYLNNQQKTDLVISSGDLPFENGEKFAYVLINGEKNQSNEFFMILKEEENRIKICFEGENSEHTEFYLRDNGRIDELSNGYEKHYANYYYLDGNGDVYELFTFSESVFQPREEEIQRLDIENFAIYDVVYIDEYSIDGNDYYTIVFDDSVGEIEQQKLREYIVESDYVENGTYLTGKEIRGKVSEYMSLNNIDIDVIADLQF